MIPWPTQETIPPYGVETVILPRTHDVGGFEVPRALPAQERQMVGRSLSSTRWGRET